MQKAELRKLMLQKRRALPAEEVQRRSESIADQFFINFPLQPEQTVHVFLPIMILPIYASARNLDKRYIEAAHDLGATPFRTFLRVVLPLTMPGVIAGIVLFFIPVFGSFVTPQFLGGTGDVMLGNVIANQFGEAFNWPFGAALSIVMTVIVIIAMTLFFRFADVEEIYGR